MNLVRPGRHKNEKFGVDGDADVLELLDEEPGAGLGTTTKQKRIGNECSHKN